MDKKIQPSFSQCVPNFRENSVQTQSDNIMTGALSYFEAYEIYFSLKQESGDKVLVKINTENS